MRFKNKDGGELGDSLFRTILTTEDKTQIWELLRVYIAERQKKFIAFVVDLYPELTDAFVNEDARTLGKVEKQLVKEKTVLKNTRSKETLCLRQLSTDTAIEYSPWFHMANNMCMAMNYNLRRITEACKEHVDNNFRPLPSHYRQSFLPLRRRIVDALVEASKLIDSDDTEAVAALRAECDGIKDTISAMTDSIYSDLPNESPDNLTVTYVYLNLLRESQEMVSSLRKLMRASAKLHDSSVPVRSYNGTGTKSHFIS